ncbi:MAG: hypothetical protein PHY29_02910 [Syntrophales bacterium]|nr:hypothetical protein [Syntrophales bacterium]
MRAFTVTLTVKTPDSVTDGDVQNDISDAIDYFTEIIDEFSVDSIHEVE